MAQAKLQGAVDLLDVMWTTWPGSQAVMRPAKRLDDPSGLMPRRWLMPKRTNHRATVATETL